MCMYACVSVSIQVLIYLRVCVGKCVVFIAYFRDAFSKYVSLNYLLLLRSGKMFSPEI